MLIYVPNEQHEYILIFDIEFDDLKLVEFSGLLFQRIGENVYQLAKSINQYINTDIGYRFVSYTNITSAFLQENGVSLRELQDMLRDFMPQCDVHQLLLVSHGLRSDLLLLQKNGID